jgi:SAM-dependent methyltransferase
MRRQRPRSIDGVNLSATQVEQARQRVAAEGLEDRVRLIRGSATALPYPARTFDVVLALECAFHFDTREDFFHEALRVLRPGGRIALAVLVTVGAPQRGVKALLDSVRARMWQMPHANRIDAEAYCASLERAGFVDVEIDVISPDLFPPLRAAVQHALERDALRSKVHPLHRNGVSDRLYSAFFTHDRPFAPLDYVIVTAKAPALGVRRPAALPLEAEAAE